MIIDDVQKRAERGDELAKHLTAHWEYPVEMIFLTPDCKLVFKLNSFQDFHDVHPDVTRLAKYEDLIMPWTQRQEGAPSQEHVFLNQMALHFQR